MKLIQRIVTETKVKLNLILTEEENNILFAELEAATREIPTCSKSILKQIHQNMVTSGNIIKEE